MCRAARVGTPGFDAWPGSRGNAMMYDACREMRLLVQADVDGELAPAEAVRVSAHLESCPACAEMRAQLVTLIGCIRHSAPYYAASNALRATVWARVAAVVKPEAQEVRHVRIARQSWKWRLPGW